MLSLLRNGYYDFALRISFFEVTESLRDFIQPVTPGDERRNLPRLHQSGQRGQVLLGYSRNKRDELSEHASPA